MAGYSILTNAKRALIALIHSIAFLLIAMRGVTSVVRPLHAASPASAWIIFAIYLVVTSILLTLTAFSGVVLERLYFAFCGTSAGFGLLRSVLGDGRMHPAVYIRVVMLAAAVITGLIISRAHRSAQSASAQSIAEEA